MYPKKYCTIEGCKFIGTRIDNHLVNFHKYDRDRARALSRNSIKVTTKKKKEIKTAEYHAKEFGLYFVSFEGGHSLAEEWSDIQKKNKEAYNSKTIQMIKKILELTFGPDKHISNKSLFELRYIGSYVEGQECVIEKLKKNNTWGTVRNYLTALGYFIQYMESKFPPMLETNKFVSLKSALSAYKTSVTRRYIIEAEQKKVTDQKKLLSGEALKSWLDKKLFSEILKLEGNVEIDDALAIKFRNNIILDIFIKNVKRTGILEALTLTHINNVNKTATGYCVLVPEGKTFASSGAAGIYFTEQEFQSLKEFIRLIRPHFKPLSSQLFCKSNGETSHTTDLLRYARSA